MAKKTMTSRGQDFDNIPYSVIREEAGGGFLAELSALARHTVDPWEAAEDLARLPRKAAAAQPRILIAAQVNDDQRSHGDDSIAIDLLTRLPRSATIRWPATALARKSLADTRTRIQAFVNRAGRTWGSKGRRSRPDMASPEAHDSPTM
jgi:hypothetical protein